MKPHLNYKFIRDHVADYERSIQLRRLTAPDTPKKVKELYNRWRDVLQEAERLRHERKVLASEKKIEEGKQLRVRLKALEIEEVQLQEQLFQEASTLPNLIHPEAPELEPKILRVVGSPPEFNFPSKTFMQLAKDLDLLDFDSAAIASGDNI